MTQREVVRSVLDLAWTMHEASNGRASVVPFDDRYGVQVPSSIPVKLVVEVLQEEYPTWRGWLLLFYDDGQKTRAYC
jgi:hypothetical protein